MAQYDAPALLAKLEQLREIAEDALYVMSASAKPNKFFDQRKFDRLLQSELKLIFGPESDLAEFIRTADEALEAAENGGSRHVGNSPDAHLPNPYLPAAE